LWSCVDSNINYNRNPLMNLAPRITGVRSLSMHCVLYKPYLILLLFSRFSNENFPKILDVVSQIKAIATRHNATAGQTTLAWILAQGDNFLVIPGTKKIKVSLFSVFLSSEYPC
jgi:hypothetical protein